ncbi:GNAT family N-acetyltransferase [Hymenobacter sp. NBH84]|uniref:GNAT family N-acetyltransferase n=1 Tax=Hymenobacter sp. NBH84 TaxID=2596915 RepID=UPI0016245303|nr:GNAT family N-acetyltransferase [Hymenobacter sp. NBH84]
MNICTLEISIDGYELIDIVALDSNQLIGVCKLWLNDREILSECHLEGLFVAPSYRGRGYGKLIIDKVIQLSKDNGKDTIVLQVHETNSVARTLYASYGFIEYSDPDDRGLIDCYLRISEPH